jgi:hypothetical protein
VVEGGVSVSVSRLGLRIYTGFLTGSGSSRLPGTSRPPTPHTTAYQTENSASSPVVRARNHFIVLYTIRAWWIRVPRTSMAIESFICTAGTWTRVISFASSGPSTFHVLSLPAAVERIVACKIKLLNPLRMPILRWLFFVRNYASCSRTERQSR